MTSFRISVTVFAVIHAVFAGFTALVGAFANGGDVWQRLLVVLLHPLGAAGLLLLVLRPRLATTKVLAMTGWRPSTMARTMSGAREGITDCLAHAVRWDGVFGGNLLIGFACFDSVEPGEGVGDIAQECAVDGFRGVAQNELGLDVGTEGREFKCSRSPQDGDGVLTSSEEPKRLVPVCRDVLKIPRSEYGLTFFTGGALAANSCEDPNSYCLTLIQNLGS